MENPLSETSRCAKALRKFLEKPQFKVNGKKKEKKKTK